METEGVIPELTSSLEIKEKEKDIRTKLAAEKFDGALQESSSKDLNEPLKTAECPMNLDTTQHATDMVDKAMSPTLSTDDKTTLESPSAPKVATEGACSISEQYREKDEKSKAVDGDRICNIVYDTRTSVAMESVEEVNVDMKEEDTLMGERISKQIEASETQLVSAQENPKLTEEGKRGLKKTGIRETNEENRAGLNSSEKIISSLEAVSGQKHEALFYADVEVNNLSTEDYAAEASQKKESITSTIDTTFIQEDFREKGFEEVGEIKSECCSRSVGEESSPNECKEEQGHGENDKATVTAKEKAENAPDQQENLEETILPRHEADKTKLEKGDRTCNIVDDIRSRVEIESIEEANLKVKEEYYLMEESVIKQIKASEPQQSSAEENPKLTEIEKKGFEQNATEENNKGNTAEFDTSEQLISITDAISGQKDKAMFYEPDMGVNNLRTGIQTTEAWQKKKSTASIIDTTLIQDNFQEKSFEEAEGKKSDDHSTLTNKEKSPDEYKEEGHIENEHTLVEDKGNITGKMTLLAVDNNEKLSNHNKNLEEVVQQQEPEKMKLDNQSKMASNEKDTTSSEDYFERVSCIEEDTPIKSHKEGFEGRAVADKSTNKDPLGNLEIQEEKQKILHTEFDKKIENVETEPTKKNANDLLLSHLSNKETIQSEDEKQEEVLVVQEEQNLEATEASSNKEKQIEDACGIPRSTKATVLEHSTAEALMTEDVQQAAESSDANKGDENVVLVAEDLERTYGLNPIKKVDGNTMKESMEGEINKDDTEEMHNEFNKNKVGDDSEKQILEDKDQQVELTAMEVMEAAISAPISNEEMNQIACSRQVHHIAHNTCGNEQVRKQEMHEGRAKDDSHVPAKEKDKLVHLEEEKEKKEKGKELQDLDSENIERVQAKESEENTKAGTLEVREELNNDDHPMNTSKASKGETLPKEIDGSIIDNSWENQMSVEEHREDFLTKEKPSIHESGSISVFKMLEEANLNETEPEDVKQQEADVHPSQEKAKDARLDCLDIIVRTDDAYNRNKDQEKLDEDEEKIKREIHSEGPTTGREDQNMVASGEQSEANDNLRKTEEKLVSEEMSKKVDDTPVCAQIPYDNTGTSLIGQMTVEMNENEDDSEVGTAFARKVRANNKMQMHQGNDQKHSSSSEDAEILEREKPNDQTDIYKHEKPTNEGLNVDKLEDKKNFEERGDNKNAILQQVVDSAVAYEGPAAENALVEQEARTDRQRIEAENTENYRTLPDENFKSAESSEEPKCTSKIGTKRQSEEMILLTSESREEIKINDIHNRSFISTQQQNSGETVQEDQNNKIEKTVINVLPEVQSHSIEKAYKANKAANITKELEGIKKDDDNENIKHQKEEGTNAKGPLPVSTEEERTNQVKDYSSVSTEYCIAQHSDEETETANFEAKGESTAKAEAAITEEMDERKGEEEDNQEAEDMETPMGVCSVIAGESEQKNKKETRDQPEKSYDKINTTVAIAMAQTNLEKSQIHDKPELPNIFLDKRISSTVETEPSQQGKLTDSTSPQELTYSSVSQPPVTDHEDIGNTATMRNPDADKIDQTVEAYGVYKSNEVEEPHETMKSQPLEKFHLDEAKKSIEEAFEMAYVFDNSQVRNIIVADLNLTAEDLNQQLQTPSHTLPLKEQKEEIIATINIMQGVKTTEYETPEEPLSKTTAEETCINKEDLSSSNSSQSEFKLNTDTEDHCLNKLNETGEMLNEVREENENDSEKEVKCEIQGHEAATEDESRADQTHIVKNLKEEHQAPSPALLYEGEKDALTATIQNSKEVETEQDEVEMSSDEIYEGNTVAREIISTSDSQDIKAANITDSPSREKSEELQAELSATHSQEQEHENSTIIESTEKAVKEIEVLKDDRTLYENSAKTMEASATISDSESQKLGEHEEAEKTSDNTFTKEKLEEKQQMPHFALPSKDQVQGISTPIDKDENVNAVQLPTDKTQENSSAPRSAEKMCLQEKETRELEVAKLGHDSTTERLDDSSEAHDIKKDITEEASKLKPLEVLSEHVSTTMSEKIAKSLEHVSEVYQHEISTKQDSEMKEKHPETLITVRTGEENQCKETIEATKITENDIANQKIKEEGEDTNNCLLISPSQEPYQDHEHTAEENSGETNKRPTALMSKTDIKVLSKEAEKIDSTNKIGQKGDKGEITDNPDQVDIQNEQKRKRIPSESKTGIQDNPNEVSEVNISSLEEVPQLQLDDNEKKASECPEREKATALERQSEQKLNPETSEKNLECESEAQYHDVHVKSLNIQTMEEHPKEILGVLRAEGNQCNQTIESTQIIQNEATKEKEKEDANNYLLSSLAGEKSEESHQEYKQEAQEHETQETSTRNTGTKHFYEKIEKADPTKKTEGEGGAKEVIFKNPDQIDIENEIKDERTPSMEEVHRTTSRVANMNVKAISEDRRQEDTSATKTAEETCSIIEKPKESKNSCLGIATNKDVWEGSPSKVNKNARTLDGTDEQNKADCEIISTTDSQDIRGATPFQSLPREKSEEQHQQIYTEILFKEEQHGSSTTFLSQENNNTDMKLSTYESLENSASKTMEEETLLEKETEESNALKMRHELQTIGKDSTNEIPNVGRVALDEISEDIEEASARVSASQTQRLRGDEAEETAVDQTLAVLELTEKTQYTPLHYKKQEHGIFKKNEIERLQDESQENSLALQTTETTCTQEEQTKEVESSKLDLDIRMQVLECPTEAHEVKKDNPEQALISRQQKCINEMKTIDCPSKNEETIGHSSKVPNFTFENEKGIEYASGVQFHELITKHRTEMKEGHPEEGITDLNARENQCKKTLEATEIVQDDITEEKIREEKEHAGNDHSMSLVEERSEERLQEYEQKTMVDFEEKTMETCETNISINQSNELCGETEKITITKKLEGQDVPKREKVEDPDHVNIQDETINASIPTEIKADIEDNPNEVSEIESKTPDTAMKLLPQENEEEINKTTPIARQSEKAARPTLETSRKQVECVSEAHSHVILTESQYTKMKEDCLEAEPAETRIEESQQEKSIEETKVLDNEVENAELHDKIAKIGASKKTEGQDPTEEKTVEDQGQVDVQKNTLESSFPNGTQGNNVKSSATEQKHENESDDKKIEAATLTEKEPGAEISQKLGNIKLAENEKISQTCQLKRDNSLVTSEKQIQIEADTMPKSVFMSSTDEKSIPQEQEDQIAKSLQNVETGDSGPECATAIDPELEYEREIDYIESLSESKKTTGLEGPSEHVSTPMSKIIVKSLEHVSEVYHHEVFTKQDAEMKEKLSETLITGLRVEENQGKETIEATKIIQNDIANQKIKKEGEDINNCLLISLGRETIQETYQDQEHTAEENTGETNKRPMASMSKTDIKEFCEEAETNKIGQNSDEGETTEVPDQVNSQNEQKWKDLPSESKTGVQDSPNEVSEVNISSLEELLQLDDNEIKASECPKSEKATALERQSEQDKLNPETSEKNLECESKAQSLNSQTMEEHPEEMLGVLRAEVNQFNQTIQSTQIIQNEATKEEEKEDANNYLPSSLAGKKSEESHQKCKQEAQEHETQETSMRNTGTKQFYGEIEKVDPTKKIKGESDAKEIIVEDPDQIDIDNGTKNEGTPSMEEVHRSTSTIVNMNVEAILEDRRQENSSATKTAEETCSRIEKPKESKNSCLGIAPIKDIWEGSSSEVNKNERTLDGTDEEHKADSEIISTIDSQDIIAATSFQSLPSEKSEEQHQQIYPEILFKEEEHGSSTTIHSQENNFKEMKLSTYESPENSKSLLKKEIEESNFPPMRHELHTIGKDSTNEVLNEEVVLDEISEDIEEASARVSASKTQRIRGDGAEETAMDQTLAVLEMKEKTPSPPLHSKEQEHGIFNKNEIERLQDESQENSLALQTTETACSQEEQMEEVEFSKLDLDIRMQVLECPTEVHEIKKDNPEQDLISGPQECIHDMKTIDCPSKNEEKIRHSRKVQNFTFESKKSTEYTTGVQFHEFVTTHTTEMKEGHPEEGITDLNAGENQFKKTIEATEIAQDDITGEKIREEKEHANNHQSISLVEERSEEHHQEYEQKTTVDLGEKTTKTCETSISMNQSKELSGETEKIIITKKLEGQDVPKREKVEDPDQVNVQNETINASIPTEIEADVRDAPNKVCEIERKTPDAAMKLLPQEYEEEVKKTTPIARKSEKAVVPSRKKVECVSEAHRHVILTESQCTKLKEDCLEAEPTEMMIEETQQEKSIEETEVLDNEVENAELYDEDAKIGATKKAEGQDLTEEKTIEDQGQVDVQKSALESSFPNGTKGNNVKSSATEQKHENESNNRKMEAATLTEKEPGAEISQKEGDIMLAENEKINQSCQLKSDNSLVMPEKQIQIEADTRPKSVSMSSTDEKSIPQEREDQIAKSVQNVETGDSTDECATAIDSEAERYINEGNKIMVGSANESSEMSQPMDSATISLPELPQMSKNETLTVAGHSTKEGGHAASKEEEQAEETKTDEDRDKEGDDEKRDSRTGSPVTGEASGDTATKVAKKKSHNILSGIGSKVKHSISKVKKAITGKSCHSISKHQQNEGQTQVVNN